MEKVQKKIRKLQRILAHQRSLTHPHPLDLGAIELELELAKAEREFVKVHG